MGKQDVDDFALKPHIIKTPSSSSIEVYCLPFDQNKELRHTVLLDTFIRGLNLPLQKLIRTLETRPTPTLHYLLFFESSSGKEELLTIDRIKTYLKQILIPTCFAFDAIEIKPVIQKIPEKICTFYDSDLLQVLKNIPFSRIRRIKDQSLAAPLLQIETELAAQKTKNPDKKPSFTR